MSKGNQIYKEAKHRSSDTNLKKKKEKKTFSYLGLECLFSFLWSMMLGTMVERQNKRALVSGPESRTENSWQIIYFPT